MSCPDEMISCPNEMIIFLNEMMNGPDVMMSISKLAHVLFRCDDELPVCVEGLCIY